MSNAFPDQHQLLVLKDSPKREINTSDEDSSDSSFDESTYTNDMKHYINYHSTKTSPQGLKKRKSLNNENVLPKTKRQSKTSEKSVESNRSEETASNTTDQLSNSSNTTSPLNQPLESKSQSESKISTSTNKTPLHFSVSWITKKRDRKDNQDSYFVTLSTDRLVEIPSWGVMDGHGTLGHNASKQASKVIQQGLNNRLKKGMNTQQIANTMREVLDDANRQLLEEAAKAPKEQCDYGTTVLVAALHNDEKSSTLVSSRGLIFRGCPLMKKKDLKFRRDKQ